MSDKAVPTNEASDHKARLAVLVVEDDEGARLSHVRAFDEHNIQMISVDSVDAALAELRASPAVDAVLTDIRLGADEDDRSGLKLAEFIRSTGSDVPIVGYSAHFATADLQQDREMFDLLRAEPGIELPNLVEAIQSLVKQRREAQERIVAAPVTSPEANPDLDIRLQRVNDELVRALAQKPELLYRLRPRQLEELMAELYAREGFEVELTAESHDGGVDIYLVRRTSFGQLLTVVDTKRHRADRPVGVGQVRQLYGVVEATHANAGVLATTSFFSRDARAFQEVVAFRLGLQDYDDLVRMLSAAANLA